ncbi:hypothetical protein JG688_00013612 [Phytophthora aleatoria]|uniref:Uncharacterized protein n=1 Tax=Phytophthora aleatoria TaxID=2496075 RepID=A0A8J5J1H3_9STRA|nr:hypothetical protein JG688_00013612 [Phytophthora aleatoria]
MLENITCSRFGAVQKGTAPLSEDARIIHDLSYPEGASINDNTFDDEGVVVVYDGPHDLAKRILEMEKEYPGITKLMPGDVAGAFRHLCIHADHVGRFAATIPEPGLLVIDLCCPFGWTMSPNITGPQVPRSAICMLLLPRNGPINLPKALRISMLRLGATITI